MSKLTVALYKETNDSALYQRCETMVMRGAKSPLMAATRYHSPEKVLATSLDLYKIFLTHIIEVIPTLEDPNYLQQVLRAHIGKFFHAHTPPREAVALIRQMTECPLPAQQKWRDKQI